MGALNRVISNLNFDQAIQPISMSISSDNSLSFSEKAKALVLQNLADEHFGVSELAEAMHVSRSSLLRNLKKETDKSASLFIRGIRLAEGKRLIASSSLSVSEVSYKVGFNSTSYFIKCFREENGYPPGELVKRNLAKTLDADLPKAEEAEAAEAQSQRKEKGKGRPGKFLIAALLAILILAWFGLKEFKQSPEEELEKSIAVLPFINVSSDSSNTYFVNGLMESTLSKLQKIEAFRVVSRTSTEQFRQTKLKAKEIGEALQVAYLVEGSGQRLGSQVQLTVQLIDAAKDKPIWSEQFTRSLDDVFNLQNEVAFEIAKAIQVTLSASEKSQINKRPTENLEAYDYYLQAMEPFNSETKEGLKIAIPLFQQAIEKDPEFALAYANVAIAYYYLDLFQAEKQHTVALNNYADKALLYDSKLAESLIAKGLYYIQVEEYRLALPHLEKALEYNPNSSAVTQTLCSLYAKPIPNTAKYLKYAFRGLQLDRAPQDSIQRSFALVHLSNALLQAGLFDQSLRYIEKSMALYPANPFGNWLKSFAMQAIDGNVERSKRVLKAEINGDTNRLELYQEVAKLHYFGEEYDSAFHYYQRLVNSRAALNLDIYGEENLRIGIVYAAMGEREKAEELFEAYTAHISNDETNNRHVLQAMEYFHQGRPSEAVKELEIFAQEENFQYWITVFLQSDPLLKPYQNNEDFKAVRRNIERRFWEDKRSIEEGLIQQGLL